ncbi:aminomethyl-transferring glycine dehydrogenase subunit GcvPA [Mesorhizobium helmanticense]|uniref:Aminomethyl-transferring glycine dehydrogenase subunit GcvPA n=2 Tax=Mesorhizobium helmanticense TaxID=1776423 RepID=A0A2T4IMC8_9HYPH|nr:aminomethyl-transferring glycine dehydrogenase subunit GcvPA [Mesorhizobium helmanticense]
MANSVPAIKKEMLDAIGAPSIEALFEQIPADHRMTRELALPPALRSEAELRRHLLAILRKNEDCEANLSFLGGGCWQHHVPAICDEIAGRSEFLTPVWGTPSSDHGRNQAWFEFTSQLGELLDMEIVGLPVYSWGCAAGHAIRMASRLTGRHEVIVPRIIDPERLSVIRNYCEPQQMPSHIAVVEIGFDAGTGLLDLAELESRLSSRTAAVYIDTPNYLGVIETHAGEIAALAHRAGAEFIVGVDPISLGVLAPPAGFGADIVVGTTQPLGVHMNCGGGTGGFIASCDEERYAREYPSLLVSIAETVQPGEHAFGLSLLHQSSYGSRENGKDWTGNSVYLWAISNAVYMSLMGPQGFREVGELIVQQAHYAAKVLAEVPGIDIVFPGGFFKEFVVRFDASGKTVRDVNRALRERGIFGGHDLSAAFPALGQSALYAVTEVHSRSDIDRLAASLAEILNR